MLLNSTDPTIQGLSARVSKPRVRSSKVRTGLALSVWAGLLAFGMLQSIDYVWRPAVTGVAPRHWPASAQIAPPRNKPVLVMFLHPHCPCSRTSLAELATLVRATPGKLETHVQFLASRELKQPAELSKSWALAQKIPGLHVACDADGQTAKMFGAAASGAVVLYDQFGHLQFAGGITQGRGHGGENQGAAAIAALVRGKPAGCRAHPVYGCPITRSSSASVPDIR